MVMKKKRILFGCLIAAFSLSVSACDLLPENLFSNFNRRSSSEETSQRSSRSSRSSTSKSSSTHVHTFSEDWEFNESSHWHPSTCGHNVKSEVTPHEYYSVVTKKATCMSQGEIVEVCTVCDYRRTRTTPASDHVWTIYDRVEPTCEEPGMYRKICSACGTTTTEYVDPLGHNYVTQSYTAPTCSRPGSIREVCSRCGQEYYSELPTSPHNWGNETYYSPAGEGGLVSYTLNTCTICGASRIAINALEGQDSNIFKTGVAKDYGFVKLNQNGSSVTYSFNYPYNAYGTMYQHGVFENAYSNIYYEKTYTYGAQTSEYNFQVSVNNQIVDLYQASLKTYDQMLSNGEYIEYLANNNYSPAADCLIGDISLTAGTNTFTYTRTGSYNLYVDCFVFVVQNSSHTHTKAASWSCDENSHWFNCIDANCPVPNTKIDMAPHTFGEPVILSQATCHSEGLQRETCSVCQYHHDTVIPATDHDYQSIGSFETTEGSANLDEYGCSTCNSYALRWSAWSFDQDLSNSVDTSYSDYVRFQSAVENANGEISTGSHIVYKLNLPIALSNVGLAFNVAQSSGYPVFGSVSESYQGYIMNQYGELERATKRYGLRVNGDEVILDDEDYKFSGNTNTPQWFNWPVKLNLKAGINTIDIYCLSKSYRGRMYDFQITGIPYLEPNHVHTPNANYDYDNSYHYHFCSAGDGAILDKEEHQFTDYVVTQDPTCDEYGYQSRTCTICGYVQTLSLNPQGHSYENYYVIQNPTCTEYGIQESTCTICGHVERWSLDPYGHVWDDGVIVAHQTHTEPGQRMYTCSVCGETKYETIKPDHNWGATYLYNAHDEYVGYSLQHCLDDGAVKIDIQAINGAFSSSGYNVQGGQYIRMPSTGQSVTYKFSYDDHAIGKLYLRGSMSAYSSNKSMSYSSGGSNSANGCNFEVKVNNAPVDMSEVKDIPFSEMLDGGWVDPELPTTYSPVDDCLIGTVELFAGENTIVYTRTGSYNLYFSNLILVVEHTSHVHTYDNHYMFDEDYHWQQCTDPNCPMPNGVSEKFPHNFVQIDSSEQHSCNEQGSTLYQCTVCGYQKYFGATYEHSFDEASVVTATNSEGQEVLYRHCNNCGRTVASMPFANGTVYSGSYDSGKLKAGTTMKWRIPVYNTAEISIYLPCKMTSGNTGQTFDPSLYELYVNGVACNILLSKGTYDELGIKSSETGYFKFATYTVTEQDVMNGEIEISFTSNVSSYRMIFDGEIRIDY